jgi:hypothetical protein
LKGWQLVIWTVQNGAYPLSCTHSLPY